MRFSENQWEDLGDYRDSLEHYGRLGMKWGQHIFGKDPKKASSKAKQKGQNRMSYLERRAAEKAKKAEEAAQKKQAKEAKKREETLRSPGKMYKKRRKYEYTQDEINAALRRFEWEKKVRDYSAAEVKAGKDFIDSLFQYANSGINLYNTSARIVNSFNLSEKPWTYVEPVKKKEEKK